MKKCTKCHKNIPSDAKVCPYCGTPQPGYQPMKRTPKRKNAFLYYILIAVLFFLPMGISSFFAFNTLTSTSSSAQKTTLKAYEEAKNETVVYQYDSLKDFSNNVKGSNPYVQKITQVENELENIVDQKNIKKDYTFQITDNNNLYVSTNYRISLDQQNTMNLSYNYDLSKDNDLSLNYSIKDCDQLDEAYQIFQENEEKIQDILYVFNGKDNKELISKTLNEFKEKENTYTKGTLSHYGEGIQNHQGNESSSLRIFKTKDTYRIKLSYDSKLNIKKFM